MWLVVVGILSVQLGAGIAKNLFDDADPTTLVWLRLATSAVVLAAIARPALRGRTPDDWRVAVAFGVTLGTMNWAIYQSFARIPLGIAVTIEFLGPLTLAVVGSRRPRDLLWALLAAIGVALLGLEPGELTWAGVGLRAARGRRVGGVHPAQRLDRATLAGPRGADASPAWWRPLVLTPFLVAFSGRGLGDPHVLRRWARWSAC